MDFFDSLSSFVPRGKRSLQILYKGAIGKLSSKLRKNENNIVISFY